VIRKIISTAGLLLLAGTAWADARDQLDTFSSDLDTLSARFEQVTRDENGRVSEESEGRLYYTSPNRFRWDYRDPFPQLMLADGERLWHYDESLEQVTVRPQPEATESPLMVLTSPELLDRFYESSPGETDDILEIRPLSPEAEFDRAYLHFDNGIPDRLVLSDQFGQQTTLTLMDVERNPELDEELFIFVLPEGVDLLEGM